jgi:Protein of unknown function (DUF3175)
MEGAARIVVRSGPGDEWKPLEGDETYISMETTMELGVSMAKNKKKNYWVSKVKTDSTHPQAGLFTKKAETIARGLASRKVSPKGAVSGMRMLTYFINRAGRSLSAERKKELEKAKALLSKRIEREKKTTKPPAPGRHSCSMTRQ